MKMRNNNLEGVTGALYIRCEKCGKEVGFYTKEPKNHFKCHCGNVTYLNNLRKLVVYCECGASLKYLTNIKDKLFDIPCRQCEAPNTAEWNEHKKKYQNCR